MAIMENDKWIILQDKEKKHISCPNCLHRCEFTWPKNGITWPNSNISERNDYSLYLFYYCELDTSFLESFLESSNSRVANDRNRRIQI